MAKRTVVPAGTTTLSPVSTLFTPVVVIPEMVPDAANDHPAGGEVVENGPPGAPLREVVLE